MNKRSLFKRSSTTYFYSSLFFPKRMRDDVFTLYAFVRTADDCVDELPQRPTELESMEHAAYAAMQGQYSGDPIIDDFGTLAARKDFKKEWIESFFSSMRADTNKHVYKTMEQLKEYMYGSAEVIGLMMNRIMDIPPRGDRHARLMGRAMQYINLLRDVGEDLDLGRTYIPAEELARDGIKQLNSSVDKKAWAACLQRQLGQFYIWEQEARKGLPMLPRKARACVKTALDMYCWTAARLEEDPGIVFRKQVKPRAFRVLYTYFKNRLTP